MSFLLTKGTDDEDATEFAYVACPDACVARENQALTLTTLRKILRPHHQEKGATEMYQLLSSGVQEGGETPQEFLLRLLDLKQKVLFASQGAGSNLKYDPKLVQSMVLHSLLTGLRSDRIKLEVKSYQQNTEVTDEELFEKLNVAVSNEMERWQKLGTRRKEPTRQGLVQQVTQLPSSSKNQTSAEGKTLEKPVKVKLLTEVRAMKVELAAIRETMSNTGPNQNRFVEWEWARPRGCLRCQRERSTVLTIATSVESMGTLAISAPNHGFKGPGKRPRVAPAGQGAAQETKGQSQQCVNCGKWEEWADQYLQCSQWHASHYCSNVRQRTH